MLPDPCANSTNGAYPEGIDPIELFWMCAQDTANSELWTEFLRRYAPKIKTLIRRCLSRSQGEAGFRMSLGEAQESDLFQNVIVRLVKNGCAAMKQFSGEGEHDLLAYMAVIARSVVRDCQRSQWALKRGSDRTDTQLLQTAQLQSLSSTWFSDAQAIERRLLAREVVELSARMLRFLPEPYSTRDRLIFQLYFLHNLSADRITQCKGINLSKAGVEKVLNRLKERIRAATSTGPAASTGPRAEVEL